MKTLKHISTLVLIILATNVLAQNNNTAYGDNALYRNTTGKFNTANGFKALYRNTTGGYNTANGFKALYSNTTGDFNTANGYYALYSNTTGNSNIANGSVALAGNTTGNQNIANGNKALYSNTTGGYNTAYGYYALNKNTTGTNNIGIGSYSQVPDGAASNQIRIGNTDITYAGVQVAWTVTSDKLWKEQIRVLPYGLDMVMQLKPVDYIRKNNDAKTREMGFIGQDVEMLLTKLDYNDQGFLTKDDEGRLSLRYNDFIALLTKAIQEQQDIIEQQNKRFENLLKRVEQLEQLD